MDARPHKVGDTPGKGALPNRWKAPGAVCAEPFRAVRQHRGRLPPGYLAASHGKVVRDRERWLTLSRAQKQGLLTSDAAG
jgi:hypothetical protein